jgi:hypothetical protein
VEWVARPLDEILCAIVIPALRDDILDIVLYAGIAGAGRGDGNGVCIIVTLGARHCYCSQSVFRLLATSGQARGMCARAGYVMPGSCWCEGRRVVVRSAQCGTGRGALGRPGTQSSSQARQAQAAVHVEGLA